MLVRRPIRILAAIAALTLALAGAGLVTAQPAYAATYTVEQWKRVDVTLASSRSYTHPDTDVKITATFTAPDGTVIVQPGFWDGGSVWKVRFAPTKLGLWSYVVTATDTTNSGLHNITGSIQANAYTGNLDIYKHGFIKKSANNRAFTYADGTPFFWLADTHWQAPNYERLNECNNPYEACTNQFAFQAQQDKARGFTVYQTYPDAMLNDGGGNVNQANWWAEQYTHVNPEAFKSQFDVMMNTLADQGTVIALGMGVHWVNGQKGAPAMTRFAEYVTARYAAYPVVWLTGQEVDVQNNLNTLPVWKAVAQTIDANDGFNHPLTAHMDSVGDPKTFGQEPWHDWFATQGGHGSIRSQAHYKTYWDYSPTKPFLETEANYEEIYGIPVTETRKSAWKALQSGSFGYSYGVAGVWANKWDYATPGWDSFQTGIPWFDGIKRPGGTQMTVLKNFYEDLGNWQGLTPRFGDPAFGSFADNEKSVLSSNGNSTYVVYFYAENTVATGTLMGMNSSASYTARWYNPRNGTYRPISSGFVASSGSWTIPPRPDATDWVLVVTSGAVTQTRPAPLVTSENLALNKETKASTSNGDNIPSKAVDGTTATDWVAQGAIFPQTLQVDLGASFALSSIRQRFHDNATFRYRLEGSNNATNWTVLVDRTTGVAGQVFTEPVSGSHRYVRLVVTGASGGHWAASDEFEVFGKNLAQGAVATASSNNGASYVAGKATDGNTSTGWVPSGASMPQWLQVDLGMPREIGAVSQRFHDADNSTFSYRIEGSVTGSTWTTLVDRTSAGVTGQTFIESVTGAYRYLKLTTTAATNGHWASSDEFRVFGSENLAAGRTSESSSTYSAAQTADRAFDSNPGTNWQSANGTFANQWVGVNFGSNTSFNKVVLSEYGNRTTGYRIEYWNGSVWTTAYTGTSLGALRTISFPAVSGSKARVFFTSGTIDQPIVYEFEVYSG